MLIISCVLGAAVLAALIAVYTLVARITSELDSGHDVWRTHGPDLTPDAPEWRL